MRKTYCRRTNNGRSPSGRANRVSKRFLLCLEGKWTFRPAPLAVRRQIAVVHELDQHVAGHLHLLHSLHECGVQALVQILH